MDSGITVINLHKQKINSKLNDNIFVIEGKAIFSCFDLMIKQCSAGKIFIYLSNSIK